MRTGVIVVLAIIAIVLLVPTMHFGEKYFQQKEHDGPKDYGIYFLAFGSTSFTIFFFVVIATINVIMSYPSIQHTDTDTNSSSDTSMTFEEYHHFVPGTLLRVKEDTKYFETEDGEVYTFTDDKEYDLDEVYLLCFIPGENSDEEILAVIWQPAGKEVEIDAVG